MKTNFLLALTLCASTPGFAQTIKVLEKIQLSPTHSIEFAELEKGQTLIIERGALTDLRKITAENGQDFATAFRALQPTQRLPDTLRRADLRAQKINRDALRNAELVIPEALTGIDLAKPKFETKSPEQKLMKGDFVDWLSDAEWFKQNFCNQGQNRWCPVNVNGWAYSGAKNNTSWFQATGFAQGFDSTASFVVKYRSCGGFFGTSCKWKVPSNGTIKLQPRTFATLTWTSAGSRWAGIDQSSDRVGLAVLWNNSGSNPGAPPASNAGPCNDLGEWCCSSVNQWGGASFYCNGNVVCQSGSCVKP